MTKTYAKIILQKRESVFRSWAVDVSTLFLFLGLIGPGIYFGSGWLQACGFVVAWTLVMSIVGKSSQRMTIQEARKWLDELETEAND